MSLFRPDGYTGALRRPCAKFLIHLWASCMTGTRRMQTHIQLHPLSGNAQTHARTHARTHLNSLHQPSQLRGGWGATSDSRCPFQGTLLPSTCHSNFIATTHPEPTSQTSFGWFLKPRAPLTAPPEFSSSHVTRVSLYDHPCPGFLSRMCYLGIFFDCRTPALFSPRSLLTLLCGFTGA